MGRGVWSGSRSHVVIFADYRPFLTNKHPQPLQCQECNMNANGIWVKMVERLINRLFIHVFLSIEYLLLNSTGGRQKTDNVGARDR